MITELAAQLAKHEVGWWQAHHRKDNDKALLDMAEVYKLLFGLSDHDARECVEYRVKAGRVHDKAEQAEDEGVGHDARVLWDQTELLLKEHFAVLLRARSQAN